MEGEMTASMYMMRYNTYLYGFIMAELIYPFQPGSMRLSSLYSLGQMEALRKK